MTNSVNRRLLTLLSRVLELPDDYLWDNAQSKGGPTGEGYFRHALFQPLAEETKALSKGLRMHGHCDFGGSHKRNGLTSRHAHPSLLRPCQQPSDLGDRREVEVCQVQSRFLGRELGRDTGKCSQPKQGA